MVLSESNNDRGAGHRITATINARTSRMGFLHAHHGSWGVIKEAFATISPPDLPSISSSYYKMLSGSLIFSLLIFL